MRIDVFFDVVCPWCFIGKRRLERAMAARPQLAFDLSWRPFQLNPAMKAEGMSRKVYLDLKFGGMSRAAHVYAMIAEAAAQEGVTMAFDRIERTPNTLDAHRLVWWVQDTQGDASALIELLFAAYFQDGRDLGDHDVLATIAASAGVPRRRTLAFLASGDAAETVRAADGSARALGIQAVPCFVIDGRYALSGAQEPEAFFPLFDLSSAA